MCFKTLDYFYFLYLFLLKYLNRQILNAMLYTNFTHLLKCLWIVFCMFFAGNSNPWPHFSSSGNSYHQPHYNYTRSSFAHSYNLPVTTKSANLPIPPKPIKYDASQTDFNTKKAEKSSSELKPSNSNQFQKSPVSSMTVEVYFPEKSLADKYFPSNKSHRNVKLVTTSVAKTPASTPSNGQFKLHTEKQNHNSNNFENRVTGSKSESRPTYNMNAVKSSAQKAAASVSQHHTKTYSKIGPGSIYSDSKSTVKSVSTNKTKPCSPIHVPRVASNHKSNSVSTTTLPKSNSASTTTTLPKSNSASTTTTLPKSNSASTTSIPKSNSPSTTSIPKSNSPSTTSIPKSNSASTTITISTVPRPRTKIFSLKALSRPTKDMAPALKTDNSGVSTSLSKPDQNEKAPSNLRSCSPSVPEESKNKTEKIASTVQNNCVRSDSHKVPSSLPTLSYMPEFVVDGIESTLQNCTCTIGDLPRNFKASLL